MKKRISFGMILVMMLGLCACGTSQGASDEGLEVGYGRENITPGHPVAIAGSATSRISVGMLDPLYITCIALRQNGETFLLATMDFVGTYDTYAVPTRAAISEAAGIPEDHILLCSTHTHASVSVSNEALEGISQYRKEFEQWAIKAAKAALEDMSPAEVWYGSTQTEGMAWVRHYKMSDGTYAGSNFGSFKSEIVGHASEADGEMQLIKFARPAEDKKDIVLMNFPAHATMNGNSTDLSADFPGPAREYVAKETDTLVAYFIAGAGNQVPTSRVESEQFSADYRVYGEELGRIAVECMNNLTKLDDSQIRFTCRTFIGNSNKEDLDRLPEAQAVQAIWDQVGGRGTEQGRKAAKEHGFESVYEVTAILNRAGFEETLSMDLHTLALGDVSFIFAPYEMFGSSAKQIKENSPYPMTFVITCAHDHHGYLPDKQGWEIRCYEAQITKFTPGTAEVLVEEYVNMLTQMKNG